MGKGSSKKPEAAPPPPPPVVANNTAGKANSAMFRKRASQAGMNYDDTLIASLGGKTTTGSVN